METKRISRYDWKKHYAIQNKFNTTEGFKFKEVPGIYLWTRKDQESTYFYVGQAKNLKKRMFDYYQVKCGTKFPSRHFECSLKKHKDWTVEILCECDEFELNDLEKEFIKKYNNMPNYITRNTSGGVGEKDVVDVRIQSNFKRIEIIKRREQEKYTKLINNLDVIVSDETKNISVAPKKNKDGSFSVKSLDCWEEFKKLLDISKKG